MRDTRRKDWQPKHLKRRRCAYCPVRAPDLVGGVCLDCRLRLHLIPAPFPHTPDAAATLKDWAVKADRRRRFS